MPRSYATFAGLMVPNEGDFNDLVKHGLRYGLLRNHPYFRWLAEVRDPRVWEWIAGLGGIRPGEGDEFKDFPALRDTTTAANVYCNLLSTLSWLCCQRGLDLEGLLVLFDESEALYAARGNSPSTEASIL